MRSLQIIGLVAAALLWAFVSVRAESPVRAVALTADQERGLKQGDRFRECSDCPEMVVVPSGSFTIGSPGGEKDRGSDGREGPQHAVTIRQPLAVGKFHVTVDQFSAFVRETGYEASAKCSTFEDGKFEERAGRSWRNPGFAQEGSHPVVCVTWADATAYVDWLAKETGRPYRLLSEAEFEYAARGKATPGSYPSYWFGDDESDLCKYGNGADLEARSVPGTSGWRFASCSDGYAYTSPVGSYRPNAFGLHDMVGNAWQWTPDCWHKTYTGAPVDGSAWTTACDDRAHVVRGGSWVSNPGFLRAAYRVSNTGGYNNIGFRPARTLER